MGFSAGIFPPELRLDDVRFEIDEDPNFFLPSLVQKQTAKVRDDGDVRLAEMSELHICQSCQGHEVKDLHGGLSVPGLGELSGSGTQAGGGGGEDGGGGNT